MNGSLGFFWVVVLLLVSIVAGDAETFPTFPPVNGDKGSECIGCVLVVYLLDGWAQTYETPIDKFIEGFCDKYLPVSLASICDYFIDSYGPDVIRLLTEGATPDDVCFEIGFCSGFPQCRLFDKSETYLRKRESQRSLNVKPVEENPWDWLNDLIAKLTDKHLPIVDIDGDFFSATPTLRGSNWRGRDCDETNSLIYPGRRSPPNGVGEGADQNCNGIYGIDPESGKTYKEQWCDESDATQMGVLAMGGSATAHFHLPPEYVNTKNLSVDTYQNLLFVIEDEIDWPQYSCYTGHDQPDHPTKFTEVASVYLHLRDHNRCNHRDYQNMGVNGFSQVDLGAHTDMIRRNQTADYPVLMFISPWGDDVCNGHPDTLNHMTTPDQMRKSITATLSYLDEVLPHGSHVMLVGLIDGSVMGQYFLERVFPVNINGTPTYGDFYEYMSCVSCNPCNGWLSTNATLRKLTTDVANSLNDVYDEVAQGSKKAAYKNIDVNYMGGVPSQQILGDYIKQGGDPYDCVEHMDGFHPSTLFHHMFGEWVWNKLKTDFPEVIGKENQFNSKIIEMFGDQGGH